MKKDYIVVQVTATPDRNPSVALTLLEEVFHASTAMKDPLFAKIDEVESILRGVMYGQTDHCGRINMPLLEYNQSGIKIGDRVTVDVRKKEEGKQTSLGDFPTPPGERATQAGTISR